MADYYEILKLKDWQAAEENYTSSSEN